MFSHEAQEQRGSIESLSVALEARDAYTRTHCDRLIALSQELGAACGLANDDIERLRVAARFHDVGKIGIPNAVLLKPGRLSASEWALMQTHAEISERIFRALHLPDEEKIARVIRHHHESHDGTGYPDGLRGDDIPRLSRILLVADAYDAMTSSRPYHSARSHDSAMAILSSESGTKLDPEVFEVFSSMIEHSAARAR